MYTILIVDDELIHRKGLSNMIKKLRPAYEVYESKNGKEALDFINTNSIDIVFTDIKMPIMDGLALIEDVVGRLDKIKMIILSGYRYFDYAQKAVSLGAFDYLLKPIREEKIVEMLVKVEKSIEEDLIKIREKEKLLKQLDSIFPVYFEHQMNGWVNGYLRDAQLDEIRQVFPYKGIGTVIAVFISRYETVDKNNINQNIDKIKQDIKYYMERTLDDIGHSISFFLEDKKEVMVSILNTRDNVDMLSETNIAKFNKLISTIKTLYELDVTIAIGDQCKNIFNDVKTSFEQAALALSYKFYYGIGKVIFYSNICHNIGHQLIDISKQEKALRESIRQMKSDEALSNINGIFQKIKENRYPLPQQFIENMIHLTLNLVLMVQDLVDEENYNELVIDIQKQLNSCEEYDELRSKVTDLLLRIINMLEDTKENKHEAVMQRCMQYIKQHFMEDISLETAADAIYFSPSYFSTCFKKYSGITFSQYLAQLRMQKALELLESSEYKVYEIALKTGYKDDKYFYRVFKKEHGITPDEYRRNNRKKKIKSGAGT